MNSFNNKTDFSNLLCPLEAKILLQRLTELMLNIKPTSINSLEFARYKHLEILKNEYHHLSSSEAVDNTLQLTGHSEQLATECLIQLFNTLFSDQNVILVRSKGEPEYFPAQNNEPARIEFAHGFFASALHELHTSPYRLTC
ncbi:MAG: elongation factor P hydroxylase [Moraxellaceae bacterium]